MTKFKVVALVSGGKDSCFNMMHCVANGHEIVALANLHPTKNSSIPDERDSMMFQTVGHDLIEAIALSMDLPLYQAELGDSDDDDTDDPNTWESEVQEMYLLLKRVKEELDVQAVSVGAILSSYQRVRVEKVCLALDLVPLAFLWQNDQRTLLQEMIECSMNSVIIKVASIGLGKAQLGKSLDQVQDHLLKISDLYGVHVCGEGGEYETITLDCPIFKKRICIDEFEIVTHSMDRYAPVLYYKIKRWSLVDKDSFGLTPDMKQKMIKDHLNGPSYSLVSSSSTSTFSSSSNLRVDSKFSLEYDDRAILYRSKDYIFSNLIVPRCSAVSIEDETMCVLTQLQKALAEHGMKVASDSSILHIYVKRMSDFGAVNAVWKRFFCHEPSSRACVELDLYNGRNVAIEYCHRISFPASHPRSSLHVQGISYWAPANIGPYSQAISIDGHSFLAGMIGLVPRTMELAHGFHRQLEKIIQSEISVLQAIDLDLKTDIVSAFFYLTERDSCHLAELKAIWNAFFAERLVTTPPTCYIIVSGLPRDASLELQLNAAKTRDCTVPSITLHTFGEPQLVALSGSYAQIRVYVPERFHSTAQSIQAALKTQHPNASIIVLPDLSPQDIQVLAINA